MKKQIFEITSLAISLIALTMIISLAISTRPQSGASNRESQGDIAQLLEERLKQLDVPVISVKISNPSPLEIEITLQSPGDYDHFSRVDYWAKCITRREVELAYLTYGTHIERYRTVILSKDGKNIFESTTYINPDRLSQKFNPGAPSDVDQDETKDMLSRYLNFGNLKVMSLDVSKKIF